MPLKCSKYLGSIGSIPPNQYAIITTRRTLYFEAAPFGSKKLNLHFATHSGWGALVHENSETKGQIRHLQVIPIGSMELVSLPTSTIKIHQEM